MRGISDAAIFNDMSLSVTKQLVKTVLSKAVAYKWSFQGFGMFRLYLSQAVRLHVWMPSLAVKDVTTIHDHPWDFSSFVVAGVMRDVRYRKTMRGEPNYIEQQIVCGRGATVAAGKEGVPMPVCLQLEKELTMRVGEVYRLKREDVHESEPDEGTVTLVRRVFHPDTEHARVYHPIDAKWVSAEPRDATLSEIGQMSDIALSRMAIDEKDGVEL